jgi:hypothetical protein
MDDIAIQAQFTKLVNCRKNLSDHGEYFCKVLLEWIENERYQRRYDIIRERWYEFATFSEFMEADLPSGLALNREETRRHLEIAMTAKVTGAEQVYHEWFIRETKGNQRGRNKKRGNRYTVENAPESRGDNNIITSTLVRDLAVGTSQEYTLRRLARDHEELFERVKAGELSANAAAIQAGFRSKTISVPVDKPEAVAKSLRKHMTKESLAELARLIEPDIKRRTNATAPHV